MSSYSLKATVKYDGYLPTEMAVAHGTIHGDLGLEIASPGRWKIAPHVALATLPITERTCLAFTKKYGALKGVAREYGEFGRMVDEKHKEIPASEVDRDRRGLVGPHLLERSFSVTLDEIGHAQRTIRLAWGGDRHAQQTLRRVVDQADFRISLPSTHIELMTRDLWPFICFSLFVDYESSRTKVCEFKGCNTQYFVQQRSDQRYCSHACAVNATNLRRTKEGKS